MGFLYKIFGNKGHRFESKVAKIIGKKVKIVSRNREYYKNSKRYCETDIETKTTAIEVKSGKGANLKSQLDKYKEITNKEPIGIAPNMRPIAKKRVREHYKVFDDPKSLRNYLISKGDGKKRGCKKNE